MSQLVVTQSRDLAVTRIEGKGRGVITLRHLKSGELIETAPVIVAEVDLIKQSKLYHYVYDWGQGFAIALGYGSLYNHSLAPNASYVVRLEDELIDIVAIADIASHEEITINYNGTPDDKNPITFSEEGWRR